MDSPKNYNEMLSKLGFRTFIWTLFFLIALRVLGIIPKIDVDKMLVPPLKDYEELTSWVLSFGAIPLIGACLAWLLSSTFEVHNKLSKLILLRYVWDRFFIVGPMLKRVDLKERLTRKRVKEIMAGLYYPEVKCIDQHYVHVFWRYTLQFWVIFEHFLVVFITILSLWLFSKTPPHIYLLLYLGFVFIVAVLHWLLVVAKKSKDQADQISEQAVRSFMRS